MNKELMERVDHHRWLLNNGLINDEAKNNIFFYGSIVHRDVYAVEVDINVETKIIHYKIYVPSRIIKIKDKYDKLSKSTGLIGLWRFRRLLKKEGNLNFDHLLNQYINDLCGPKWSATFELIDKRQYIEGADHEGRAQRNTENN